MKRFLEKNETFLSIALIVLYIVINSFCLNTFGATDFKSALINTAFSAVLLLIIFILKRRKYYGLTGIVNIRAYLYFIPLALIVSVNLWGGINIKNTREEIIWHIVNMLNIGFIEEIIFRGFLFKMMAKDNVKLAISVSAITFGIGHIVNLFNGADVIYTVMQILYAISVGYLFVMIFHKSGSLIPCIIAHSVMNALSIFSSDKEILFYITSVFLIIVPVIYLVYINKKIKE